MYYNKGIIELHCHTKMSEGRGLIPPSELVKYAYDNGYKAIAITDCGSVQAFPEAYREWSRLWNKYQEECRDIGKEAVQEDFLKIIYGLEGNLLTEEGKVFPVLIYAKNETGLRNLYRIVTASYLEYYDNKKPMIPKALLEEYRDGLIIGSAGDGGEVYTAIHSSFYELGVIYDKDYLSKLKEIASFYDFLEVARLDDADARYMYLGYVKIGTKPMVVASDACYISEEDKICYDILTSGREEQKAGYHRHLMNYDDVCKKFFNTWTWGNPEEMKIIPDVIFDNRSIIEEQIGYVNPLRDGKYWPEYPNAIEELTDICESRVKELFGDKPNFEVRKRLERELEAICQNGYAGIYMLWRRIVKKSLNEGYPVGIRGAVGSSLVAYLCGITEINPLSPESGGYHIPVEVFMGLNLDKEPDIDINFSPVIQETVQNYIKELPGVGETCYGGTIASLATKTAENMVEKYLEINDGTQPDNDTKNKLAETIIGVKRGNGMHPGGIIVCPEGEELVSFTPLSHPNYSEKVITHFDYHDIWDNLLKLDILGHDQYELLHFMQENTGVRIEDIPLDDEKTLALICDVKTAQIHDLPEFGSEYVRRIIKETVPKSFDDLVKISAVSHGTDVWYNNQDELIKNKIIKLVDCIASRDDIMIYLMDHDLDKKDAYQIMESVRKGRGLKEDHKKLMTDAGIPDWYMQVCEKIKYLFPKAHAVSYTLLAVRLAYYMVYYPDIYQEGLSSI